MVHKIFMDIRSHDLRCPVVGMLAKFLCVLTAVGVLNVHMALFQCYAWASMLHDRIPEQGIEQALSSTFDGDHPCEKCKALAEQRVSDEEQKSGADCNQGVKMPLVYSVYSRVALCLGVYGRVGYDFVRELSPTEFSGALLGPPPRFVV